MFRAGTTRIFGLASGADFPARLVDGLLRRTNGQPPEAMARVTLFLNTERMRRRVTEIFARSGAGFLPKLRLITELSQDPRLGLPPAIPPLRRRLELTTLIAALLDQQPELAPRAALYELADSLAALMDEMQGEGVTPKAVADLDVSSHSQHWARTQTFLQIIAPLFPDSGDQEARQRAAVQKQAELWKLAPPADPIIVAGSTGSRGSTALFMQAVAMLPQGALVIPGFDYDLPHDVWGAMTDALAAEDHPQFRFRRLLDALNANPEDVSPWCDDAPPDPARNKLISLSLRPAPVTHQWLIEGPALPDLVAATANLSLVEAPSPRLEALAIALVLRQAVDDGVTAALITPDRNLARQVTAALDRWGVLPDDSAGKPLAHSAPGRFLRQVAALFGQRLAADQLLGLLKHPLTASGGDRGVHLRMTHDLELTLRKFGPAFPSDQDLRAWANARKDPAALPWVEFLVSSLSGRSISGELPLLDLVQLHRKMAEALANGLASEGSGGLWDKDAGAQAKSLLDSLQAEASYSGPFSASAYIDLFESLVAKGEVREPVQSHPNIMIWGTLEARVQGADLVILGGLNDSVWPKLPAPDPWLNRQMRKTVGLLLPERQIGLSAHDYQQAVAAPKVILSRSVRDAEAETVPSRWLNRLLNLMDGLPDKNGKTAMAAMRLRGDHWLTLANVLERPTDEMTGDPRLQPAKRPAPQPPVSARPARMSLTRIETLIRDPYSIYARYILNLMPLDPLHQSPNARDRGVIVHRILENFVTTRPDQETRPQARQRLLSIARNVLAEQTPFPAARALWLAKLDRASGHFLALDAQHGGTTLAVETKGELQVDALPFVLFGTPDRIDRLPDGSLHLIDYKTGTPPTKRQQTHYAKQLILAAAMAERGGFASLGPSEVSKISYVGLGSGDKAEETDVDADVLDQDWAKLIALISRYLTRTTGYASRRAVFESRFPGDYDHLARYGEWQMSDRAVQEMVGPENAT